MRKHSSVLLIATLALLVGVIPTFARDDHSIEGLDTVCRALQVQIQEAVGNEDPAIYRNHGAYVSTVAHMVDAELMQGNINEECASCIVSQFARRVPIEEQEPCGPDSPSPECEGANCGNFLPCNEPNDCSNPVCVTTADGGGACLEGSTACAGLTLCPAGTGDCPDGYVCAVQTCCGDPVCVPPSGFCATNTGKATVAPVIDGPTLAQTVPGVANQKDLWGTIKTLYRK